eukprot:CAMPEP_0176061310 /NCGR_PEP_ID=MMETSP0120_2-20121206/30566_1 /TAXON_ID=160619 /ORGANISM="Kryptoperidinium foliaceum, Strain CCMP 1326" /LENGTH=698 /DNA_ID=CAMNT_0017394865 /DNA_START=1 /DNA_END=2093 /DNA_ORIENTATION=+
MTVQRSLFCALAGAAAAAASAANPLEKVVALLSEMQQQVIAQGEKAQKIYNQVSEECEDRSRQLHYEIKTMKGQIEELKADISEETAKAEALTTKITDLGGSIAEDEAELKAATERRKKEAVVFGAAEKELMEMLDALRRAESQLERQGSAAFVQTPGTAGLVQVLETMVEANAINFEDADRLTALVQSSSSDGEGEDEEQTGAPAADSYQSKSGAVTDVLEKLSEKTEDQLDTLRKEETSAKQNYELKTQALNDQIRFGKMDMDAAKKDLASADEAKAGAEGDLQAVSKDLAENIKVLGELHHDCMSKATSFEEETKSRGEELKALAEAKKAIVESTGGASQQTYGQTSDSDSDAADSFVQLKSKSKAKSGGAGMRAVHIVRKLAMASRNPELSQLASRMGVALRMDTSVGDPFAKVRGLISDMVAKLEEEAGADAKKKAWCDKETKETLEKKGGKEDDIEGLTTKIEKMTAASMKLKEEVSLINKELGALTKFQAEADGLRGKEKGVYAQVRPQIERGIEGVKMALRTLKEYYAQGDDDKQHSADSGGASGVIGMLEVVESDFSKQLSEIISEEERAQREYDVLTKENQISKASKEADVKHKEKEATQLDKAVAETKGDLASVSSEYSAIMQYWTEIQKTCTAKPEPYEERVKARGKEIEGLKQALDVLEGEAALVQRRVTHRTLRGSGVVHLRVA